MIAPPKGKKWNTGGLALLCAVFLLFAAGLIAAAVKLTSAFRTSPRETLRVASSSAGASSASPAASLAASSGAGSEAAVSSGRVAYLTFDDGPSEFTPQLLSALQRGGVKATFFITFIGHDSPQKRAWVKQELALGETIGEHSWTHNYAYIYSSEQNFMTDLLTMRSILYAVTGSEPRLFRFPGGVGNTVSLSYHSGSPIMPTLVKDVKNLGMVPFDWTAGGEDAEIPRPATGAQFAQEVLRDIGDQKDPIILMHDRYQVSVDAVPIIIRELRAKGYSFAVLSPSMPSRVEPAVLHARRVEKLKK